MASVSQRKDIRTAKAGHWLKRTNFQLPPDDVECWVWLPEARRLFAPLRGVLTRHRLVTHTELRVWVLSNGISFGSEQHPRRRHCRNSTSGGVNCWYFQRV